MTNRDIAFVLTWAVATVFLFLSGHLSYSFVTLDWQIPFYTTTSRLWFVVSFWLGFFLVDMSVNK